MTEFPLSASSNVSSINASIESCLPYEANDSVSDQALMTTGYAILFVLSLTGNTLIIAIFFKEKHQLRTPVHYFIVNMAVSDLFVPIFVIPRRIKQIYFGWGTWLIGGVMGEILCKIVNFADEVSVTVSSQSMVFIATERFWAIVFPTKLPLISQKNVPVSICFTWISSTTFFSYYLFAYGLKDKGKTFFCGNTLPQIFDSRDELWRVDRLSLLVIFVAVPFVLLVIFYSAIIITLRRQEKTAMNLSSEAQQQRAKENKKVTLMLVTVVILFFLSWTPYYIYFFLYYYSLGSSWSCDSLQRLRLCGKYMNYIYTAANPLIYYTFNATFRQGFRRLLDRPCCFLRRFRQRRIESEISQHNVEQIELSVIISQNQSQSRL